MSIVRAYQAAQPHGNGRGAFGCRRPRPGGSGYGYCTPGYTVLSRNVTVTVMMIGVGTPFSSVGV